ncbi:pentapeptide repeat-containing protein [Microbacterium hydrocarbonoxydans]|uniref:pentapeptide repeat-containing protein n=1 Tax=Microbacterium hydrocarbonoxydans TaxID=273678 RepID=UPI002040AEB6|nr:pentapeptide repeat-containing protein [Microbacterium hydrocarbonoxydans]MCM3780957.1 pentapeptide repeat-containing protein [Microbacterium hydrocarbonoxydans]
MARTSDALVAPRVSPPDLPPQLDDARPARGADLFTARLDLDGTVDLAHSSLEQCTISADADSIDLTGATLIDVGMTGARIASLRMRDANVRRVRITGGRLGTLDLSGARIDELELRGVRIDYLNLGAAKATDVEIAECGVRTFDMPQAELTRVRFADTRSDEVDPRGLRATHVDLRGLDAGAFLDANSLRGTTLSSFQVQQLAPVLAASIGIRVID